MAIQAALDRDELSVDLNTIDFADQIHRDRPIGFCRGEARLKNRDAGADDRGVELAPVAETGSYGTRKITVNFGRGRIAQPRIERGVALRALNAETPDRREAAFRNGKS